MGLGALKIRWWATAQLWAGAVLELLRGDRATPAERLRRAREAATAERCRCGAEYPASSAELPKEDAGA
jgi:hypothetical protein